MIDVHDPRFREYATERQLEYLDAVIEHGSARKAAEEMKVHPSAVTTAMRAIEKKAAKAGYAPKTGHDEPVPPGFMMERFTEQIGPTGKRERIWVKGKIDPEQMEEMLREMMAQFASEVSVAPVLPPPSHVEEDLLNLYTFTDYHLGMLAWHAEGGDDWDLEIATKLMTACFEEMLRRAAPAKKCVINVQGDFLHTDGMLPVTPTNHHVLDADTRFRKIALAAIMVLRRLISMALVKHEQVELLICEGNHDESSSLWMQLAFAMHFQDNPRVAIHTQALPYYAIEHGKTMLAFHHGHKKRNEDLPLFFADQFSEMWGRTTKRYCNTGHRHHLDMKDHPGMTVMQHPTLAARDAHASRGGWSSIRAAVGITFHRDFGRYDDHWVTPEMVQFLVDGQEARNDWPV